MSLVRVIQHVDWQVWDGNGGGGGERYQQHQHAFAFLQRQVQLVRVFFTEERQVNGTPARKHEARITELRVPGIL